MGIGAPGEAEADDGGADGEAHERVFHGIGVLFFFFSGGELARLLDLHDVSFFGEDGLEKFAEWIRAAEAGGNAEPSGSDGADGEDDERDGHGLRRLVDVVLDLVAHAWLAKEGEEDETAHVEGGHEGGGEADEPENAIGAAFGGPGLPEDFVFGEESGEAGNAGDGEHADEHGPERGGSALAKVAHELHILLTGHGVNNGAGTEEEQGLEEGVSEDVEDSGGECADAEREEHVAELGDGGVGEHALDVVLNEADGGGEDSGEGADDGDCFHGSRGEHEDGVGAGHHVNAGGDHGGGVDEGRNGRGAFHGVGQPDIQRKLGGLAAGSDKQEKGGGGEDGIADGEVAAAQQRVEIGEAEGA